MFSHKSALCKLSYRGYVTARNIRSLKTLILELLQIDSEYQPILRSKYLRNPTPQTPPVNPQHLLTTYLQQPKRLTSLPEPLQRMLWTSSTLSCQLQLASKFQLFLQHLHNFCNELHCLGHPHHHNDQGLGKVLDCLVVVLKRVEGGSVREARRVMAREYNKMEVLRGRIDSQWLRYLGERMVVLVGVLGQVQFWVEQVEALKEATSSLPPTTLLQSTLKKSRKAFYKHTLTHFIRHYVSRKQHQLEICLSCQRTFPSSKMSRHIKSCRALCEIDQLIESIDAEVAAKLQDLKQHATQVKKMQLEKKEKQQQQQGQKRGFYKKEFSKSAAMCRPMQKRQHHFNQFMDHKQQSQDSSCSQSNSGSNSDTNSDYSSAPHRPLRPLPTLTNQQLLTYLWLLQQLRLTGNKVKAQRQSSNVQLFQELRNLKTSVQPKFMQLRVQNEMVERVFKLLSERMESMEKMRKIRKQQLRDGEREEVDSFCTEFEDWKSTREMKTERSRYKKQLKNADEGGFFSEEESSRVEVECGVRLRDFRRIRTLGQGRYGEVWLVRKKSTKVKYAMKRVYIQDSKNYTQLQNLQAQNNVFSVINSPYLVKAVYSFSQGNHHYFVMQYMPNGDFSQLLSRQHRLYEDQSKLYLAQIVLALEALHEHGITHRDIKPQNIVIDKNGHLKITDYGLSEAGLVKRKQQEQKSKTLSRFVLQELSGKRRVEIQQQGGRIVGSPYYMAPEVLAGGGSTAMSDWWSFGILVYHTLLGVPPFTGNNLDEIKQKVLRLQTWPPCIKFGKSDQTISYEAKDLIDKLLVLDPKRRLGSDIDDIKLHNFFDGIDWENLNSSDPPIEFECQRSTQQEGYETEEENPKSYCGSQGVRLIRRDILNEETEKKHLRGQARFGRLLEFASRLERK